MKDNFDQLVDLLKQKYPAEKIRINELLSKHTFFGCGGPARIYFEATTQEELIEVLKIARAQDIASFVIGGGTNLLISDYGIRGLVIKNSLNNIKMKGIAGRYSRGEIHKGGVCVSVESGVMMNQLVRWTLEQNLSGLEAFLGQPGTLGGAIWINAHNMKMGEFIGDKIDKADLLDNSQEVRTVERNYFHFSYDYSIIQKTRETVLSATFNLIKEDREKIWQKANQAIQYRKTSQPQGVRTFGCTFRNISIADAVRVGTPNRTTSAGFLLEAVGLKNYVIGGAGFSQKHANFIVNNGNAKSSDVQSLITVAKKKVKERFGINLKEEIVVVGEKEQWIN